MLFIHRNILARAGISALAGVSFFDGKGAEAAQFYAVARCHGVDDFVENGIYDALYVAVKKMRVIVRNFLDQFGFYHVQWPPEPGPRAAEPSLPC